MSIYTRQGDSGKTRIYAKDTRVVNKDDDVLECYGSLDELNAQIGLLLSLWDHAVADQDARRLLEDAQRHLFAIGFGISDQATVPDNAVVALEQHIDKLTEALPAQRQFILPGGTVMASHCHVCRTVARRAERRLVALMAHYDVAPTSLHYLNRLSDYLFVLARFANHCAGIADTPV
ncbi:cob(I)yrinic acid a,c-diamide adenosyltransferase [Aestuariibacter halophilus]|uniref:Corrinoid adenosyltransferase n=1 Tax=Fluctibacter halophilus TaxID=226011 RepID=A0ABS8G856_9ALTE|nr:cob(I)yrinic acid a,c-diamide adenosyltransferase [Aestuariibacter halophilus]MCC2615879.1 cob(I)yrinic acid a,c-diamide adenosyltransferase [Aestuariibacter halophilus]